MQSDFVNQLTAQSTLAELPAYAESLDLSVKGGALGDLLQHRPEVPGVVVTDGSTVRGVISRGQYLRLVGRNLGREVFHPRPLSIMFDAVETLEEPMVLPPGTPIQEAVSRALGRPRALIYEPLIVGEGAQVDGLGLIDFPDLLRADSRISQLRNRQMKQILETVQEGFLLVDSEHRIASEYSSSIETIFGMGQLAGRRLPAVLGEILSQERAALARDYLQTLFNPNVIEKLVVKINPLLQVQTGAVDREGTKHLAFTFKRSLDGGAIRQVLVRVEDVSHRVEMAAEIEAQEQKTRDRLGMVFQLIGVDPDGLLAFLKTFERRLAEGEARVASGHLSVDDVAALFRHVHSLKGEAGLLGLEMFQRRVHAFEERLVELRERRTALAGDALGPLEAGLGDLRDLLVEASKTLDQLRRLSGATPVSPPTQTPRAETVPTPRTDPKPSTASQNGLFGSISKLVTDLGQRLGKPTRFVTQATEQDIPTAYGDLVREALVQMARNSVVHGIESPEERRGRGKPEVGTLQFAVRQPQEGRHLELVFQDDGAGIDLEKIRRRAEAQGVPHLEDRDLLQMIFSNGFSTAEETTVDAGRGVGMDLVKQRVEGAGGTILPHTQPGVFCAFQIVLPRVDP